MISEPDSTLDQLVERVGIAVRKMGAQSVITSHIMAKKFGLHKTDLECLDILYLAGGACSPGFLAQAVGLTSGATTAMIDRLENAGYVVRESDPSDRRKQIIRVQSAAIEPIQSAYEPMQAAMFKLWSRYDCRELEVIEDFLRRSTNLSAEYLAQAESAGKPSPAPSR